MFSAMTTVDTCVRALIVDELKQQLPQLEAAEEQAAKALRAAVADLEPAEKHLAELSAEVDRVRGLAAQIGEGLDAERAEDRIEWRVRSAACSDELSALEARRDQAQRDIEPLFAVRNKRKDELSAASAERAGLLMNLELPYLGHGQRTDAYATWRAAMGPPCPRAAPGGPGSPGVGTRDCPDGHACRMFRVPDRSPSHRCRTAGPVDQGHDA